MSELFEITSDNEEGIERCSGVWFEVLQPFAKPDGEVDHADSGVQEVVGQTRLRLTNEGEASGDYGVLEVDEGYWDARETLRHAQVMLSYLPDADSELSHQVLPGYLHG